METLYQKAKTIKRIKEYFHPYLRLLTQPSGEKLFLLLLAMLTMQTVTSIHFLYKWFLSKISPKSLNSYYHLLAYAQIPLDAFFRITVKTAMALIPEELNGLPIFLIIDDTLQAKFGTHFECYQTMFDHAKHNGSNYLKGHCFVALMISVPVRVGGHIRYFNIPVGFRLRQKDENKLKIASKMIDCAMLILGDYQSVILLCDSWYPKGDVRKTVARYKNLDLIANVRVDSSLFELPPPRTGKPGRPATKGKPLDIHVDFHFIRVEDYYIATRQVMTNLFDGPIYAMVTTPNPDNHNTYRLFISTLMPRTLCQFFKGYDKMLSDRLTAQVLWLFPLFLYSYRWAIEVCFLEMKTFWSFGKYMLRTQTGIENFVNMTAMCYSCMKVLPLNDIAFASFACDSPQTVKYAVGEAVRCELFFHTFVTNPQTGINLSALFDGIDASFTVHDSNVVS